MGGGEKWRVVVHFTWGEICNRISCDIPFFLRKRESAQAGLRIKGE